MTDASPGRTRILILDDDEAIRRIASRVLRQAGYDAKEAASAEEARTIAETGEPIHLLLSDLALDGLQGREAAIMLQARRPEMRVLFMSGSSEADFREQIENSGTAFLQKPFDLGDLLAAVKRALEADPSANRPN